jgi:hypothetical protein
MFPGESGEISSPAAGRMISMCDRKNTATSWMRPFRYLPLSGLATPGSAIVALPGSGADHLVYVEQPSAADSMIPAISKHSLSRDKTGLSVY